jgi:glycosyltransferase involved in cell wall biosynthesis
VVTQLFPPETAAGAKRVGAFAAALARGFDVTVATLEPGYPDARLYAGVDWRSQDAARGHAVRRRPAFRPHGASLPLRALREIAMSAALVGSAGGRADLVLVSTPSMFLAPFAWMAARLRGARFAWDVRDLTWRYARESAPTGGGQRWLLGALEGLMLHILRRADLVIAATEGLAGVLRRQGVPAERMVTIPNGVSRELLDAFPEPPPPRLGRPRVTYAGLMGYNHGIGILVEVAARLPHVDFALVGDGPERAAIEARLRDGGPANVVLRGYVTDPADLVALYRASDVLVNHTKDTPTLDDIVFPAKTFEYFATRRPVVHAGRGWSAELLRERDVAVVVPPGDAGALARGIEQVLAEPERTRERCERARRFVEQEYAREAQAERLAEEIGRRFGPRASGAAT